MATRKVSDLFLVFRSVSLRLDRVSLSEDSPHNPIEPKISNDLSKSKGVVAVRLAIVPPHIAINKPQKLWF